jgi:hypothetical protein
MEILELLIEGIKYALPALLVYLTVRYLKESQVKEQRLNQRLLLRDEVLKQQLPLRVSAHERAVLFLERISPQNLLLRVRPGGKSARMYQGELVREIQSEFDHNLAQQIFLSNHGWAALVHAKDEVIGVLHAAMEGLPPEANDLEFSKKLIEKYSNLKEFKTQIAINELKKDLRAVFKV